MKVFTNQTDTVIAESIDDIRAVLNETLGPPYDEEFYPEEWNELDQSKVQTIVCDQDDWPDVEVPAGAIINKLDDRVKVTAPLSAWVDTCGRSFLCSTEY
jgi:hypothetical protein